MIQILLLILKICGIALLAILGLVLLVVAVVLFVPVFYRVRVIHNPEKTQVKARISFLFPAVIATVEYLNKLSYKLRVFGIPLLDSDKPKKEKALKAGKAKKKKPKKEKTQETESEKIPEPLEHNASEQKTVTVSDTSAEKAEPEEVKKQKTKKTGVFDKVRSKITKIRETISNIVNKIRKLFHQKEKLQQIFAKPETKRALGFVWDKLKHLLRHVFPRKLKGYVIYGADDPATTGKVLGILSIVYARTGQLLAICPNFTEKQLECDVELKGRIQLFTLLVIAVKVFFNQELKNLINELKTLKEIE